MRRQKKRKRPPLLKVASHEYAASCASWSAREHECQRGQNPQVCIDSEQSGSATRSTIQSAKSGPWWRDSYQKPRAGHLGEHLSSFGVGAGPPSVNTDFCAAASGSSAKESADNNDDVVAGAITGVTVTATKAGHDRPTGVLHCTATAACCPDGNSQPSECVNADSVAEPCERVSSGAADGGTTGAINTGAGSGADEGDGTVVDVDVGESTCGNAAYGDAAFAEKPGGSSDKNVANDAPRRKRVCT